jgi:hypothetical protein
MYLTAAERLTPLYMILVCIYFHYLYFWNLPAYPYH